MLKIVVFPAPFGPISAISPPSETSNEAPDTARRPRKDFDSARTASSATSAPASQAEPLGERRPDAVGHEHHDQQQDDAVEHLLHARNVPSHGGDQVVQQDGERSNHGGAEGRAEQGADPAHDRPEDDLDRLANVEELLGKV